MVWDERARRADALGRFGWKANVATVEQQAAGAFLGDIGITSSLHPDAELPAGPGRRAPRRSTAARPEITDDRLAAVTFYGRTLAVPAMRDADDADVVDGRRAVRDVRLRVVPHADAADRATATSPPWPTRRSTRTPTCCCTTWAPGLADGRPDFDAAPQEWRTPPLWGLGLVDEVNGAALPAPRRPGRDVRGGDPVARRRGRGGGRGVPHGAGRRSRALLAFLEAL